MNYFIDEKECSQEEMETLLGSKRFNEERKIARELFENGCYEYELWDMKLGKLSFLPKQ